MKKLLPILAVVLFLIVTPVLAEKGGNRGNNNCDPNANWRNHGEYVSCVARLHKGGEEISEAAKSDVGKKDDENENEEEENESPRPSVSPSASPTPSGSPVPSSSPSASPSASPTITTVEGARIEINALIEILQNLIKSLKHLI